MSLDNPEKAIPYTILREAHDIIHGPRRDAYGPPEESFDMLSQLWSAILKIEVSPADVALMMIALKLAREANNHQRDNLTDICGYAQLLEIIIGDDEL